MSVGIADSVVEAVGGTPLVRLGCLNTNRVEILAKLEYLNPGGSTKDRPFVHMLERAERSGKIGPEATIIDSSSGNFAIAMAMAGAARGYRVICVVDPKLTATVERMLRALGAELRFADRADRSGSFLRHRIELRDALVESIPGAWCPDQYRNPGVVQAHDEGTGQEIVAALDAHGGRVDALVVAVGTGGTVTGCARRVKQHFPAARVVACDAYGSKIFDPSIAPWLQKGLGSGLAAEDLANLDLSLLDEVRLVDDADAFQSARALAANEGILAGGSSGSAVFAALTVARGLEPGARVVTILPDRLERYLEEHVTDSWMERHGLTTELGVQALDRRVTGWLAECETVIRRPGDLPVLRRRKSS